MPGKKADPPLDARIALSADFGGQPYSDTLCVCLRKWGSGPASLFLRSDVENGVPASLFLNLRKWENFLSARFARP